jgi:hypothetical protein
VLSGRRNFERFRIIWLKISSTILHASKKEVKLLQKKQKQKQKIS